MAIQLWCLDEGLDQVCGLDVTYCRELNLGCGSRLASFGGCGNVELVCIEIIGA